MQPVQPDGELNIPTILEGHGKKIDDHDKRLAFSDAVTTGVVIVLFLGFIGLIFTLGGIYNDYLAMKQATYTDLRDKVAEQNIKINNLQEQLKGAKFIYLQK